MRNWFTCKVKYQKPDHQGKLRSVSESYLVDAVSFTDAESRIYEELDSMIQGEFAVNGLTKNNYADIFHYDDSEKWVKCKVSYVTVDEESGKESKINNLMLVTADTLKQAYERIEESLSDMLVPFEINNMADTNLMDVFPFNPGEKIPDNLVPKADYKPKEIKEEKISEEELEDFNEVAQEVNDETEE